MSAATLASPLLPPEDDKTYLRNLTLEILAQARVAPGTNGPPGWKIKNTVGFPLVTPGRTGYPAFWIRDFSMATDSGLVPTEEIRNHLRLVAQVQTGQESRKLQSGSTLPPFAIPDHINFDGSPVFFPGTYSPGEDQGGEQWGLRPPFDDHYEFVHLAYILAKQSGSKGFLNEEINGILLKTRLEKAFECPEFDPKTELARTTAATRGVGFGFCDSIVHTGNLLYASLLRLRSARELAELTKIDKYKSIAKTIQSNLKTFHEEQSGWLLAATEIGKQPDVWGTLYALHLNALDQETAKKARQTIVEAYKQGTIELEGAVRHVPTDRDYSPDSAWEKAYEPKGYYQNGAYWHTPTGWLIECLVHEDKTLAKKTQEAYIKHLKGDRQAPWECFNPAKNYKQNGGYLTSVALPYATLKTLKL